MRWHRSGSSVEVGRWPGQRLSAEGRRRAGRGAGLASARSPPERVKEGARRLARLPPHATEDRRAADHLLDGRKRPPGIPPDGDRVSHDLQRPCADRESPRAPASPGTVAAHRHEADRQRPSPRAPPERRRGAAPSLPTYRPRAMRAVARTGGRVRARPARRIRPSSRSPPLGPARPRACSCRSCWARAGGSRARASPRRRRGRRPAAPRARPRRAEGPTRRCRGAPPAPAPGRTGRGHDRRHGCPAGGARRASTGARPPAPRPVATREAGGRGPGRAPRARSRGLRSGPRRR